MTITLNIPDADATQIVEGVCAVGRGGVAPRPAGGGQAKGSGSAGLNQRGSPGERREGWSSGRRPAAGPSDGRAGTGRE